jgi:hypothetical protein
MQQTCRCLYYATLMSLTMFALCTIRSNLITQKKPDSSRGGKEACAPTTPNLYYLWINAHRITLETNSQSLMKYAGYGFTRDNRPDLRYCSCTALHRDGEGGRECELVGNASGVGRRRSPIATAS